MTERRHEKDVALKNDDYYKYQVTFTLSAEEYCEDSRYDSNYVAVSLDFRFKDCRLIVPIS